MVRHRKAGAPLNRLWMSSMLQMFAICSSARIFSRQAFSSGVRFFLAICATSNVVLLFYTTSKVYTKFGTVSSERIFFGNERQMDIARTHTFSKAALP